MHSSGSTLQTFAASSSVSTSPGKVSLFPLEINPQKYWGTTPITFPYPIQLNSHLDIRNAECSLTDAVTRKWRCTSQTTLALAWLVCKASLLCPGATSPAGQMSSSFCLWSKGAHQPLPVPGQASSRCWGLFLGLQSWLVFLPELKAPLPSSIGHQGLGNFHDRLYLLDQINCLL